MERKKKIISFAISIILVVGSLTGCGVENNKDTISVVTREEGSGTRGAFVELTGVVAMDENGNKVDFTTVEAISVNSTAITMTTVAGNNRAIGYISLGSLNNTVKAVQIDGVEPTAENIKNGSYILSRPFYVVTKKNLSKPAKDFIHFILSADGQTNITENGYIEVNNIGTFVSNGARGKVIVSGSSSVTPIMQKLQEAYQAINTNVKVEVQESDTTTGINSTINGTCDIGMASRELKDEEASQGLAATAIAMDGIVVVIHNDNKITDLTTNQVKDIFTGKVTCWSEVKK
ncbi:MAG: phosphate ABC transporter substrate-binding protein [Lachnospiraceae bacterium]|nr:phosphate ABC transporter substrate-binding protein [Lachnospiraceae bacterium]